MAEQEKTNAEQDEVLPKNVNDLSSQLATGQDRLASDINELIDRANPKNVAKRVQADIVFRAKSFFVADNGEPHLPRIAGVVGGVVGVTGLVVLASVKKNAQKNVGSSKK